ncbi:MAG TPA: DUF362 domain-containing protein [Spirochaetota bacterium]|nr:DUF362 domain-containing protein [Spirochaetota bacterium]HPG51402.1 DUF362 domain-containing protein [Spirochaetota bacterium]HPN11562.1 DUF362 domain-containing protein [Spirochaetota bacterium]
MGKHIVAIARYREPLESVRKAVELSGSFDALKSDGKVFIKPNIVVWTEKTVFPKWGVITTSRVIEDIVLLLKERGITDITIGEGIVTLDPKNTSASAHAYKALGYEELNRRYGVKFINVFERPFRKVDIGDGFEVKFNEDILDADFVVNTPVLKTHVQAVVSLGMKNLKGMLDIPSRKKCHTTDPEKPLVYIISHLPKVLPPSATIIDGIFSLERGPSPDGKARRSDIIIASPDMLSADMVGAKVLGHEPATVPAMVHAARTWNRPADLSDIEVKGEPIESVASFHEYDFPYNKDKTLHLKMEKMGVKGLSYRKYDDTMCTYCSVINGALLMAIMFAWKGQPWDDIEILSGKKMQPTPGKKKTILLGQCMFNLHKNNPVINEMLPIKGCPPKFDDTIEVLHNAGIQVEPAIFNNIEMGLSYFMSKYQGKPEFDESFFRVD